MASFQQSKRSDNKRYTVEVRWGIFIENLTVFLLPKSDRKYSHTNSYIFTMTAITQEDHLTVGAWAACALTDWSVTCIQRSGQVQAYLHSRGDLNTFLRQGVGNAISQHLLMMRAEVQISFATFRRCGIYVVAGRVTTDNFRRHKGGIKLKKNDFFVCPKMTRISQSRFVVTVDTKKLSSVAKRGFVYFRQCESWDISEIVNKISMPSLHRLWHDFPVYSAVHLRSRILHFVSNIFD